MKYLIVSDKKFGAEVGDKLIDQIELRDVRKEVERLYFPLPLRHFKKSLGKFNPHIVVFIGADGSNKNLISYAKKRKIKTCYYKLNYNASDLVADLTLLTYPPNQNINSKGFHFVGNPLHDLIKDHSFNSDLSLNDREVNVAVSFGDRLANKSLIRLIQRTAKGAENFKFHISVEKANTTFIQKFNLSNIVVHVGSSYELMKECNVAITSSSHASLSAAFMNCPQVAVQVSKRGLHIFRSQKRTSLINILAGKEVIREFQNDPKEILKELHLILEDQQYCSSILDEYQSIKNRIGHERASKKAAQIMVDFLESSSS